MKKFNRHDLTRIQVLEMANRRHRHRLMFGVPTLRVRIQGNMSRPASRCLGRCLHQGSLTDVPRHFLKSSNKTA